MGRIFLLICLNCTIQVLHGQEMALFEKVPHKISNVKFSNDISETRKENIFIYDNFYAGSGVGLGDINNDGLLDIYFCGNQVKDRLYINKGNFVFEDITKRSGIGKLDSGWSSSVTLVDINNDGFLDIYVTKELYDNKAEWRRNKFYLNQGDETFVDIAQNVGLGDTTRTRGASFFDYDKDGDLDVLLLHQPPNPGIYSKYRPASDDGRLLDLKYAPRLYRNTNGIFKDVSEEANALFPGFANACSIMDFNNDGYPDIVIANDFEAPDRLLVNLKNGKFENIANAAFKHTSFYSMGIDVADINNDGLLDIYVVDMVSEDNFRLKSNMSGMAPEKFANIVDKGWNYQYMYNVLQLNNGNSTFSDVAKIMGVSSTDWSWSPLLADFDNDGLKDIFVSNGLLRDIRNTDANKKIKLHIHEKIQKHLEEHGNIDNIDIWDIVDYKELTNIYPSSKISNKLFKNNGDLIFSDISGQAGVDSKSFSNGSAYGDLDNDGDLDLVVNNINEEAFLFRNNSDKFSNANYLRIQLVDGANRSKLGTKVTIYCGDKIQFLEHTNVRGMYSTSEQILHFGLGGAKFVDSLLVEWPNSTSIKLRNIVANQVLRVNMDQADVVQHKKENDIDIYFKQIPEDITFDYVHQENIFDDYQYQVLLPHKMSQFGPALAKGDINNDGLEDVFIGGATGFSAALFTMTPNGDFLRTAQHLWDKESGYEDVDAVFVDINGDGFQDIYVVSGGNEFDVNDPHYGDRLYLNDGNGGFTKGAVLDSERNSGSKVIAGDYDNDGDLDLFVAGRHVPHHYPLPATSMLLKNENGQLVNKSSEIASEFKDLGMVTDAVWSDYDDDGDIDLIIVGEWMPITIFNNNNGILEKVKNPGLDTTAGWWFSIEQGDFDNDGDIDYIAGNIGLNYKYSTSLQEPFDIYFNDFDNNGKYDIVLGYYSGEKHYPLRGFSCSSEQIPGLKDKIKKYDLFASLEIEQVYGEENLEKSLHYKADTFASSYIENLGDGNFKVTQLPNMAQLSSINDFLVEDFNGDGNLDALAIGNLYVSEIETPRNDAGTGILMLGNGLGGFTTLSVTESGFLADRDAKKIISISNREQTWVIVGNNNDGITVFQNLR